MAEANAQRWFSRSVSAEGVTDEFGVAPLPTTLRLSVGEQALDGELRQHERVL